MLEFLFTACQSTFLNAKRLVITAMQLFDEKKYEIATFCAMTAIEEIGKVVVLRVSGVGVLDELSPDVNGKYFWINFGKSFYLFFHRKIVFLCLSR